MKSKKAKYQRRHIVVHRYNQIDDRPRQSALFMPIITQLSRDIAVIANKKGFNKKDFSRAFREFQDVIGVYPFPDELVTSYMKRDRAFKRIA